MNIKERISPYGDVECNESLRKHTTFRIGGECAYFVYPKNEISLMRILDILKEEMIEYKIFGKGSNILCGDDFYDGVILCLDRYMSDFYFEQDGTCIAQAGCSIILLAHEAMKLSLTGLEFASGIPGTLGGAAFMNAGAYKSDMQSILQAVWVLKADSCEWIDIQELGYRYRHSKFQEERTWIILAAKIKLTHGNQQDILDLMDSRRKRRLSTQPLDKPSAGSMFRNPQNAQAWELIENVGYRGKNIGGAMVSDKHANFIVNSGNAMANDVIQLVTEIQQAVKKQFDIDLHMEVERFNWKI